MIVPRRLQSYFKEKLNQYRKHIENHMEKFKDIERENKTKPHSKQGLSAEEKLDPREKEKADTIEWLQVIFHLHFLTRLLKHCDRILNLLFP